MPGFLPSWITTCEKYGMVMTQESILNERISNEKNIFNNQISHILLQEMFYGFAGMPLPEIVKSLFLEQKGSVHCCMHVVFDVSI